LKRYGLLTLKILLWILGSVIFLVLLVFILIEVPAVQNFARKKAVSFLEGKIKTKVEINKISLDLPKLVVLEDVYFEDQKKDTLLAGDTLKVDISLLKLLDNQLEINEIDLRGITTNIQRTPDSVFNFDYIIKAFVSEQKKEPKPQDTSAAMKFSIEKINLDRIRARFNDAISANDIDVYLGHFDTRIKEFDLDKMKFEVPAVDLSGVNAKVIQRKPAATAEPPAVDSAEASKPMDISLKLGKIDLAKIKVDYQNDVSAMKAKVNLGNLEVETKSLDLKNQRIALKSLDFNKSDILFVLGKKQAAKVVANEAQKEVASTANNWRFTVNDVNIQDNDIRFDNFNMPVQRKGIDFAHLNIKGFSLDANNILYAVDTISGSINEGGFKDKSGFALKRLHTNFFYGKKEAYLNDLDVQTNSTHLTNYIRVSYPSIESLSKNIGDLNINADLDNSRLGFRDILTFVPTLSATAPFNRNPNAVLRLNGKIQGRVSNLNISNLEVSGLGNTYVKASAKLVGLPDMNKARFDVNIANLSSRRSDITGFLPPGTLPANISLPESFKVAGTFKGAVTNFNTNLDLTSSYGSAKAIATYNAVVKGRETYKANVRVYNFNVGRLIKQPQTIGRISLAANVTGTGIDPKKMNAHVAGKLVKAEYNKYTYRNLNLDATARAGAISAKASMSDPNLDFDLDAKASMKGKYPSVAINLDLDSANLQRLNFAKEDMRFHGQLVADIPTADPDYLNGNILLKDALVVKGSQRIQLDSVSVISKATADSNALHLKSTFLSADITGKYKLTQIGTALQDLISKYYSTGPKGKPAKYSPQMMAFKIQLANDPIIQGFMPSLKEMAPVKINGRFDSQAGELVVDGSAPRILVGTNNLNNLRFNINTDEALNYSLKLDQINSTQFQLVNTSISGNAANNILNTDIQIRDKSNKQHYRIAGALRALPDAFEFSLRPDGLILNYQPWSVSQDNQIQFGNKGISARNFALTYQNQTLSINTTPAGANNPLAVDFKNFKIETLTQIAKKDSLLLGGTINGGVLVRNLQATPVFTSDLNIGDFSFRGDTVGNIALKVNNEQANDFAANVSITGKGNQVDLNGHYLTGTSSFDMNLNIVNLSMKSIQGFTMGSMNRASGNLTGQLAISGTADAPKVRGGINFNNTAFNITSLNSYFRIPNNRIAFNDEGIGFNNFTLVDSANNKAVIDGQIYTSTFRDYRFDLNLRSDNFQVINSSAKDNDLYYGKLLIDTRMDIGGTLEQPKVDGSLKIDPETNLSVVLPQTDPGIEEREGIVEFIDKDNPQLATILPAKADSAARTGLTGIDVSVNITVDKKAEFNLIVDAANGDFLKLRGEAQLAAALDPSGKTSLTGTYEMEEGAYELSFNFLKRRFDIKPGSTITWNGDVMDADLDVTAIYLANTAPLDLVQNQLADAPPTQLNIYKQKLPFEVHLTMKGELMKPAISFDVVLPEKNYNVSSEVTTNVSNKLTQIRQEPSELNKQVFALLLLNRFVSENPFQSNAGGGGAESLARQSASKLLSQQLNNLAGNLIQGVELNFDLESSEDYTTGQMANRTDLNVGLSKRLLNDRLKVSVGSNFELEGPRQANRNTSNLAGNVEVEYQLSKDGRFARP